jgi:6-phosphogluconolactonase
MSTSRVGAYEIVVFDTAETQARGAAQRIAEVARASVTARGVFTLALSGGSTPRRTYEELARLAPGVMRWEATELFFGDERCVPPDDAQSNYRMARETLLDAGVIGAERVHRIRTELGMPARIAADYDGLLRGWFAGGSVADVAARDAAQPTFDLAILGVGDDGHTASLFPGSAALDEEERWAIAAEAPVGTPVADRVTVTLPVLNHARNVVFLCSGAGKQAIVREILTRASANRFPAARVRALETTAWLLDAAAAPR